MERDELRDRVRVVLPGVRTVLEDLVRIESVGADPARRGEVERSADAVRDLFAAEGFDSRIARVGEAGPPAVIAHRAGPEGAPTVMLYAHHDVQPENDRADWDTPPFEPIERNGRLYGRGSADDKAGIAAHLAAVRALGDDLAVGVTIFAEGEEETGSTTLAELLVAEHEALAADVIVAADSANWGIGVPAFTTTLRGLVRIDVEVRTITHAVHSGNFGGLVPDALMTLSRLISSMYDEDGRVAVEGMRSGPAADVAYTEEELRFASGAVPGLEWIGSGPIVERLWTQPAITVIGIDAPRVDGSSSTLTPSARARISIRTAPMDTTANAAECLRRHLEAHVPWGAELTFTVVDAGEGSAIDATGALFDVARNAYAAAWDGVRPVEMGVGGSVPFIAAFLEAYPQATVLATGMQDHDSRAHGANEGLHLAEWERACLAETILLHDLGSPSATPLG